MVVTETMYYDETSGMWTTRKQAEFSDYGYMVFPVRRYEPVTENAVLTGFSTWHQVDAAGERIKAQAAPVFELQTMQQPEICIAF